MKTELIEHLKKIAVETSYFARIRNNPSTKKVDKENAIENLSTLSDNTVSLFKEHKLLDLIRPNRNKDFDKQWYDDVFGNGAVADIKEVISALEKLTNGDS